MINVIFCRVHTQNKEFSSLEIRFFRVFVKLSLAPTAQTGISLASNHAKLLDTPVTRYPFLPCFALTKSYCPRTTRRTGL